MLSHLQIRLKRDDANGTILTYRYRPLKEVIIVSKDDIVALRADVLSNPTMEGIALLERALNASRWEGVTDINHVLDVRDR